MYFDGGNIEQEYDRIAGEELMDLVHEKSTQLNPLKIIMTAYVKATSTKGEEKLLHAARHLRRQYA